MGNVQVNQNTARKQTKTMGQTWSKKNEITLLKTAEGKVGAEYMKVLLKSKATPIEKI